MLKRIIHPFLLSFVLLSCNSQPVVQSNDLKPSHIVIHRFDKLLYDYLKDGKDESRIQLKNEYAGMLDVLSKGILNITPSDTLDLLTNFRKYYSEPTLHNLYSEAIAKYDIVTDIEGDLTTGFSYLHDNFPSMQIPAIYMHVSGLNQNVLVADSLLSISIDKYMGSDYPLYKDFFYEPQRRKMQRSFVAPDYLAGWLLSEYPYVGEQVLLDKMIYEGKIKYLQSQALPETTPANLIGYTEEEVQWCQKNEEKIWKTIIERKHLFTTDRQTTARYFEDIGNSTFLANDAPGNIGTWMGWQVINEYMKKSGATPQQLMQTTNAQEILRIAEYKP